MYRCWIKGKLKYCVQSMWFCHVGFETTKFRSTFSDGYRDSNWFWAFPKRLWLPPPLTGTAPLRFSPCAGSLRHKWSRLHFSERACHPTQRNNRCPNSCWPFAAARVFLTSEGLACPLRCERLRFREKLCVARSLLQIVSPLLKQSLLPSTASCRKTNDRNNITN